MTRDTPVSACHSAAEANLTGLTELAQSLWPRAGPTRRAAAGSEGSGPRPSRAGCFKLAAAVPGRTESGRSRHWHNTNDDLSDGCSLRPEPPRHWQAESIMDSDSLAALSHPGRAAAAAPPPGPGRRTRGAGGSL